MSDNKDYLYSQLVKLGDMMGDGLHHEPDGRWIEREYKEISKALFPEMYAQKRAHTREKNSAAILEYLKLNSCPCGGTLKQKRAGTKSCYCETCNKTYSIVIKRGRK